MYAVALPVLSLLAGIAILLTGIGLLGTLLGVRAGLELFPDNVIGAIMAAYFLGFIVGTFICPWLIRRVGHIRAFAAMAAVASATALIHAIMVDPWSWAFCRLLTGICLVGIYMVIESWLNTLAPNHQRGRIFGLYMTVTLLAMAAGQFLFAIGNPQSFVPFALVSMLFSIALVPVVTTRVQQPESVQAPSVGLFNLYRTSPLGAMGSIMAGLVNGAFWGMGAVLALHIGLSGLGVALFMSAIILGGALLQWPIGRLSDRLDRRAVLATTSFLGALVGLSLFFLLESGPLPLGMLLFLYGGTLFSLYSLSVAHANDLVGPGGVLETSRGLLLLYGIGAATGPVLAGVVMQAFGPATLVLFTAAGNGVLGLLAVRSILVRVPVPAAEKAAFVPMIRTSQTVLEMHPASDVQAELDLKP